MCNVCIYPLLQSFLQFSLQAPGFREDKGNREYFGLSSHVMMDLGSARANPCQSLLCHSCAFGRAS